MSAKLSRLKTAMSCRCSGTKWKDVEPVVVVAARSGRAALPPPRPPEAARQRPKCRQRCTREASTDGHFAPCRSQWSPPTPGCSPIGVPKRRGPPLVVAAARTSPIKVTTCPRATTRFLATRVLPALWRARGQDPAPRPRPRAARSAVSSQSSSAISSARRAVDAARPGGSARRGPPLPARRRGCGAAPRGQRGALPRRRNRRVLRLSRGERGRRGARDPGRARHAGRHPDAEPRARPGGRRRPAGSARRSDRYPHESRRWARWAGKSASR